MIRKNYKAYNEKICYKDVVTVGEPEKAYELLWGEKPELCRQNRSIDVRIKN